MFEILPKQGLLLIKKHKNTKLSADIAVMETDDDKTLITAEVVSDNSTLYKKGATIVCGKYAIYELVLKGESFFFLNEDDVIAVTNYTE
jgi:co-chaperonin GroES (HSP10)